MNETRPEISVVVPVYNEAGNCGALAREIAGVLDGRRYEIIFVDDASGDSTREELAGVMADLPVLRVIGHETNAGQSRATRTGALAAHGRVICTLDGDGQNDPVDLPAMIDHLNANPALGLVSGRRKKRQDSAGKRIASQWANAIRRRVLRDDAADSGSGIRAMRRDAFMRLPYFDHMHRYMPALMKREGFGVAFVDVGHRAREAGRSKYTNFGRAVAGAWDLLGVSWLIARNRNPGDAKEVHPGRGNG